MKKNLAVIIALVLCASAVAAQASAPPPAPQQQQSPELAEAARLSAEVVRLYGLQQYDEALEPARRAVELRERALGPDHMLVANARNNLGAVLMQKGKYDEAARVLARSLAIMEKNGAGATEHAADIGNRLGLLALELKNYKEAVGHFQRALAIREKARGASDPALVPQLLNLTDAFFLMGDREQAHASLDRATEILNTAAPKLDLPTAKKLQTYICLLKMEGEEELLREVQAAVVRLESPEREGRSVPPTAGGVLNGRVIKKPPPEYPSAAKNARVSGTVVVRIMVDETGKVIKSEAICGHPLLQKAAAEAAAARFTPTLLHGQPVKVTGIISYNFVLQ